MLERPGSIAAWGVLVSMTLVFTGFAALFSLAGWLLPNTVHRIGFWMAGFYLLMAASSAILTLVRPSRTV